mmetsp:Transcript_107941/g.322809  ORF Transcript_107941/g.322809 Transcript_107941/m.322809 type:complete len:555 (-) Transcript_107941:18-1682(-)
MHLGPEVAPVHLPQLLEAERRAVRLRQPRGPHQALRARRVEDPLVQRVGAVQVGQAQHLAHHARQAAGLGPGGTQGRHTAPERHLLEPPQRPLQRPQVPAARFAGESLGAGIEADGRHGDRSPALARAHGVLREVLPPDALDLPERHRVHVAGADLVDRDGRAPARRAAHARAARFLPRNRRCRQHHRRHDVRRHHVNYVLRIAGERGDLARAHAVDQRLHQQVRVKPADARLRAARRYARGPHDRQVYGRRAVAHQQHLRKRLRVGVVVVPAVRLRAPHAPVRDVHLERFGPQLRRDLRRALAAVARQRAVAALIHEGRQRPLRREACLRLRRVRLRRRDLRLHREGQRLPLRVQLGRERRFWVKGDLKALGPCRRVAAALPVREGGGAVLEVCQARVASRRGLEQAERAQRVGIDGSIDAHVPRHQRRAVNDHVKLLAERRDTAGTDAEVWLLHVTSARGDAPRHPGEEPALPAVARAQPVEDLDWPQRLQPRRGVAADEHTQLAEAVAELPEHALKHHLAQEPRRAREQHDAAAVPVREGGRHGGACGPRA